jgi:hypothetical protein
MGFIKQLNELYKNPITQLNELYKHPITQKLPSLIIETKSKLIETQSQILSRYIRNTWLIHPL